MHFVGGMGGMCRRVLQEALKICFFYKNALALGGTQVKGAGECGRRKAKGETPFIGSIGLIGPIRPARKAP